jgi:multidrug efflux pump subunit AcrB
MPYWVSFIGLAEAEYMVRASGYLQTLDDFKNIVLKTGDNGVPAGHFAFAVQFGDTAAHLRADLYPRDVAEIHRHAAN